VKREIIINTIMKEGEKNLTQVEFLEQLANLNLNLAGIEVRSEYFSNDAKTREKEFQKVKELSRQNNWKVYYSVHEELFTKTGGIYHLGFVLEAARHINAKSIKMNIGDLEGIQEANVGEFNELIKNYGIKVTVENNQTSKNGTFKSVAAALEEIRRKKFNIGYTFDSGNWHFMDEKPLEALDALKSFITVLHLKNMNVRKETTLLDEGVLKWKEFIALNCPIILEYPVSLASIKSEVFKIQDFLQDFSRNKKIQVAIDRVALEDAQRLIRTLNHADIIELGTSLSRDYGLRSVYETKHLKGNAKLLVDIKTVDQGDYEFTKYFEAGADILTVMGTSAKETLDACYEVAKRFKKEMVIDLLECSDERIETISHYPEAIYNLHFSKDGKKEISATNEIENFITKFPHINRLSFAGSLTVEKVEGILQKPLEIIVVGSSIVKSENPKKELDKFMEVVKCS